VTIVAGILIVAQTAFAAPAGGAHPRGINARQDRQAARIASGIKSGEITKGEARRLRADEAAVRAEERVDRRSGGGLSRSEARDLQKDLNRTSREIHRARHNGRPS
jgi:hypothetical protein